MFVLFFTQKTKADRFYLGIQVAMFPIKTATQFNMLQVEENVRPTAGCFRAQNWK